MTLAVLIPVKPFTEGKTRLSPACPPEERAGLCARFFATTLETAIRVAGASRVHVLTSSAEAGAIARNAGAGLIADAGRGLNAELIAANAAIAPGARLAILPTDLPQATAEALARVLTRPEDVVVVPDRHGDGTNLMLLSPAARRDFPFGYGPRSRHRHLAAARERGLSHAAVTSCPLALDIDTPEDLTLWRGAPACLAIS